MIRFEATWHDAGRIRSHAVSFPAVSVPESVQERIAALIDAVADETGRPGDEVGCVAAHMLMDDLRVRQGTLW